MKKAVLLTCLVLSSCVLFAQSPADSAKKTGKLSISTLRITDGAAMLPTDDIVTNISRSKELSIFYNAIQVAGLSETFRSRGPLTILAPTNQAFAGMPAGMLDTLLKPAHKYELIALLTYHAIPGTISSEDISRQISQHNGLGTFITLGGAKLTASIDANRNIILVDEKGGKSVISKFDIKQSNGLIHLINSVLVPKPRDI